MKKNTEYLTRITEYQSYIFDLDGTLYSHKPVKRRMAFALMLYYGIHFWRIKEVFVIRKYRKLREQCRFDESIVFYGKNKALLDKWLINKPLKFIKKYANTELLDFIKKQYESGKEIIVYSDYPVDEKLTALGILDFVKHRFSADDTNIHCLKPDPKGLEYIISSLKLEKSGIIYIGDRDDKDGVVARAAGVDLLIIT